VSAADTELVTKVPLLPRAPQSVTASVPEACAGVSEFAVTNCVLRRYGLTLYATYDVGVGYQTHGLQRATISSRAVLPYSKIQPPAALAVGTKSARDFDIGIRGAYNIAGDTQFIFQVEAGFNPILSNSSMAASVLENVGKPLKSTNCLW